PRARQRPVARYADSKCTRISFFFHATATTEIYTLSLHDALPIYGDGRMPVPRSEGSHHRDGQQQRREGEQPVHSAHYDLVHVATDRKSTRLNSSHVAISYAVFCLKKKKTKSQQSDQ